MESLKATEEQMIEAVEEAKRIKDEKEDTKIADLIQDASPVWKDAISFSRQGHCSSTVQRRAAQIEQNWNRALKAYGSMKQKTITKGTVSSFR